jgi:spermidine synthase
LSFGLSAGTETAVQCAGEVPDGCRPSSKPENLAECSSLDSCGCDLHGQELPFSGMQAIAEKVVLMCNSAGSAVRILMIGLGGGAISSYIRDRCPAGQLTLDNVEKDGRVAGLASKFFGFKEDDKSTLQITDGLSAVLHGAQHEYDAVLVDCFAGKDRVPESCRDAQFLGAAKQLLKPDGLVMQNIWGHSSASTDVENDFQSTVGTYAQVFGQAPRKEVVLDVPQALQYMLYGLQGQRWSSLLPAEAE